MEPCVTHPAHPSKACAGSLGSVTKGSQWPPRSPRPATNCTVVNHGTGIPRNAILLARRCGERGIDSLGAPVSGGRPGAEARTLTTLVGGPEPVVARCEPIFRSFASHVKRVGDAGAGQMAKLFNNALATFVNRGGRVPW